MFFYDPFICVQKRRKKSPQKKITISVQKQFLKLLQPHQGAEPSAGFYILEKVGKRLPPAGTGRKYRVFQLWEYGFMFWKKLAKGSRRRAVDENTRCSNSENTFLWIFIFAISKASPATPRSGTICWFYILEKVGKRLPPAGSGRKYRVFQTKIQGVPTLRIRFYTLEKVGKRLLPAGSGQKYRVFQLREYFSWILIL